MEVRSGATALVSDSDAEWARSRLKHSICGTWGTSNPLQELSRALRVAVASLDRIDELESALAKEKERAERWKGVASDAAFVFDPECRTMWRDRLNAALAAEEGA